MNQVFQMYQESPENYMSQEDAQIYTNQKLKIKLQTKAYFIVFQSAPQTKKPDFISHISLKIKDIINKAVDQKKLKEILTAQSLSCDLSRVGFLKWVYCFMLHLPYDRLESQIPFSSVHSTHWIFQQRNLYHHLTNNYILLLIGFFHPLDHNLWILLI